MVYFVAIFSGILGFLSIHPDPSGNIYFILPNNLFSGTSSAFPEFIQSIYNSFSEYFSLLPNRLELNFLGFIWYLFLDLLGILMIIGLFNSIYYSLHTLGIIDYIKRKKFLGTFIDVIIGLIFGLIFGCIIGIVIKPYNQNHQLNESVKRK